MARYVIWIEIEEQDDNGEPIRTLDLPFGSTWACEDELEALEMAAEMHRVHNSTETYDFEMEGE